MAVTASRKLTFSPIDSRRWFSNLLPPGQLGVYVLIIGLAGSALFLYALSILPLDHPLILVALCIIIFAVEWAPIKLTGTPLQGHNLSAGAAVAFAALLILGPAGAISIRIGSALAYWFRQKRPLYKRLFTTATLVLSSGIAGVVYILAGGTFPIIPGTTSLVAACLAASVYFFANTSLISGAVSLESNRPFRSVYGNWGWLFLEILTALVIGLGMALAYNSGYGSTGFLVVGVFLVLPWYSAYFYVQKTTEITAQSARMKQLNAELNVVNDSLSKHLKGLQAIQRIGIAINSARSLPEILHQILDSVVGLIGANGSSIFLESQGQEFELAEHIGLSSDYAKAPEFTLDGSAKRALRENRRIVMDKSNYQPAMLSSAAAREGILSAACLPLVVSGDMVGALDVSFTSEHVFTENELEFLVALAEQAAVAIHNARLIEHLHENYLSTIRALAAAVEAKDPYTRGHSEVVRKLAIAIGRRLELSAREIEVLNVAALFHDIGKVGIPESILSKPERLNEGEWALIRQHPIVGQHILSQVPALADVHPVVRHHHERYDGAGYPDGICAEEDTLAAIISVADTYEAITSERPYRQAQSHQAAIVEIKRVSGSQLVPRIVDSFISVVESENWEQMKGYHFEPGLLCATSRSN